MENNKTFNQLLIAILVAVCGAIVAFFTSCAAARYDSKSYGRTSICTVDTTYIYHDGTLSIKIK
nr:MAG TPA: Mature oligodendrocyte transmembrane protein [Microviridae sp.]